MDAGKLDRRISIYSVSTGQDEAGQPTKVETLIATPFARRMEQRLSEVFAAGADRASDKIVWRIRFGTPVPRSAIVVYGAERFEVASVMEFGRRYMLDLETTRLGASA